MPLGFEYTVNKDVICNMLPQVNFSWLDLVSRLVTSVARPSFDAQWSWRCSGMPLVRLGLKLSDSVLRQFADI